LSGIFTYASGPSITALAGGAGAPGATVTEVVGGSTVMGSYGLSGMPGGLMGTGNSATERPNQVAGMGCGGSGLTWVNPAKFTLDGYVLGSDPNSGRGICSGPGIAQTDFSLRKNFKITERVNLQFELDFFNFFNKTQFNTIGMNLSLSNNAVACGVGASSDPNQPWCAGHANNTAYWTAGGSSFNMAAGSAECATLGPNACTVSIGALQQSSFGQVENTRDPREIQYGIKIDF
jgi:hypothetical protein